MAVCFSWIAGGLQLYLAAWLSIYGTLDKRFLGISFPASSEAKTPTTNRLSCCFVLLVWTV
jgi:hypothetical protein